MAGRCRSATEASGWYFQRPPEIRLLLVAIEVVELVLDALADVARDVLHLALDLVELAFALELAIAGGDAAGLLDLALQVVEPAFQVLLVHARLLCGPGIRWPPDGCAPSLGLAGGDLLRGREDGLVRRQHALRVDLKPPPGTAPALESLGDARPGV